MNGGSGVSIGGVKIVRVDTKNSHIFSSRNHRLSKASFWSPPAVSFRACNNVDAWMFG